MPLTLLDGESLRAVARHAPIAASRRCAIRAAPIGASSRPSRTATAAGPRLSSSSAQAIGADGAVTTDARRRTQFGKGEQLRLSLLRCASFSSSPAIADGVDGVRYCGGASRCGRGADQIKIMLSGGVASPLGSARQFCSFSIPEIPSGGRGGRIPFGRAMVCGARLFGGSDQRAAVTHGVRTIEHGKSDRRRRGRKT